MRSRPPVPLDHPLPRDLMWDLRGLTLVEIMVALAILVVALAAIYGLVSNAIRSFGLGEDFLDVQQNARVALERFAEEGRWTRRLIGDTEFFARAPSGVAPPACAGGLCADSVNLEVPRSNPIVADCSYFVRFARDSATSTFTRQMKPDPDRAANPNYGAGRCVASEPVALASYASDLVINYCDGAGTCTPPYTAVAAAQVVRINGDITVTKASRGRIQARRVGTDVLLRNVGAAASPGGATPTPTFPRRPTPESVFQTPSPAPPGR